MPESRRPGEDQNAGLLALSGKGNEEGRDDEDEAGNSVHGSQNEGDGPVRWTRQSALWPRRRIDHSLAELGPFHSTLVNMQQRIAHVALVVSDYDEAIAFYTRKLHFTLVEDTYQPAQDKRWVVVAPPANNGGTTLLLARASTSEQAEFVGNQCGGRVFLFLETDDFWRDFNEMSALGIRFVRPPSEQSYGIVAVWEDLYGNRWDLVEYRRQ